jgi:hypothetical protein
MLRTKVSNCFDITPKASAMEMQHATREALQAGKRNKKNNKSIMNFTT